MKISRIRCGPCFPDSWVTPVMTVTSIPPVSRRANFWEESSDICEASTIKERSYQSSLNGKQPFIPDSYMLLGCLDETFDHLRRFQMNSGCATSCRKLIDSALSVSIETRPWICFNISNLTGSSLAGNNFLRKLDSLCVVILYCCINTLRSIGIRYIQALLGYAGGGFIRLPNFWQPFNVVWDTWSSCLKSFQLYSSSTPPTWHEVKTKLFGA